MVIVAYITTVTGNNCSSILYISIEQNNCDKSDVIWETMKI